MYRQMQSLSADNGHIGRYCSIGRWSDVCRLSAILDRQNIGIGRIYKPWYCLLSRTLQWIRLSLWPFVCTKWVNVKILGFPMLVNSLLVISILQDLVCPISHSHTLLGSVIFVFRCQLWGPQLSNSLACGLGLTWDRFVADVCLGWPGINNNRPF